MPMVSSSGPINAKRFSRSLAVLFMTVTDCSVIHLYLSVPRLPRGQSRTPSPHGGESAGSAPLDGNGGGSLTTNARSARIIRGITETTY